MMKLLNIYRNIKRSMAPYRPAIEVLINQNNLRENLHSYQRKYPQLVFAPVLKSNAYGHGLVQVAKILDTENTAFIVLDSLHEAIILRHEGIKKNILVVGFTQIENIKTCRLAKVAFTVTSLEQLQEMAKAISTPTRIHLKIDTGMHRQGLLPEQIQESMELIKNNHNLILEGICSHLADADSSDQSFTDQQVSLWNQVVSEFKKEFTVKYTHLTATAGAAYSKAAAVNVGRLGIGLYGFNPLETDGLDLRPVMEVRSLVSSIKLLPKDSGIGYNLTFKSTKNIKVATVPMGYYEGVDRRLSNRGWMKINEVNCPIVGRVSMNITSIDVSEVPNIKLGDKVTVISGNRGDKNSVENIAIECRTIPYEILVHIPQQLRRIVY